MSKCKFFALGGLGEIGKNMYVLEVDERIFILDAGSKFPDTELLGIDSVYPNIRYLEENKNKIVGIFLTHGHEENIGATIEVLKRFNIGVFGSHFTIGVLEQMLTDGGYELKNYRLYRINEEKMLSYGPVKVQFFFVSHNIPETTGIAIHTEDGAFVYVPDFNFDVTNDKKYRISFDKITELGKKGVFALACDSLGVNNITRTHNNASLEYNVSQLAMKDKRIIISLYSTDLVRLQRVINSCLSANRRIAIIGRKTQKLIAIAINLGYLNISEEKLVNLKFRDEVNKNTDKDLAIIVTGARHEPYYSIQRMCRGQDKLIKIEKGDEILFVCPPQTGCERIASRTLDEVLMSGAKCYSMKEDELRSSHADSEELKMLYNLLKPKVLIPINGEYRHQYVHKKIALSAGFKEHDVIVLENGEVLGFEEGIVKGLIDHIQVGDVMVDGEIIGDVNDMVLKDRELMSEDGILIVNVLLDKNKKKIIDGPIIKTCGVIIKENDDFIEQLENEAKKFLKCYFKMVLNDKSPSCNEMLRSDLMNYLYQNCEQRPIIVPSVIEI